MYSKPLYFKAYSVIIAGLSILLFFGSIVSMFAVPSSVFDGLSNTTSLGSDGVEALKTLFVVIKVAFFIAVLFSLFFTYVDISSIYAFAQMIEHEQSGAKAPFVKQPYMMSSKFYRNFGTVVFTAYAIISFISIIANIISYSISQSAFLAVPVFPIAINLLSLFLNYITFYCRYKTFADLLDVLTVEEPGTLELDSLKENKSGVLRGYCIFLFAVTMALIAVTVIGIIVAAGSIISAVGLGLFWVIAGTLIALAVLEILQLSIVGCYFDGLAKMLEHNQIVHKLL